MAPGATKHEELIREEKKIGAFAAGAWTVTLQAPLSMEFSRQEYWCGLPFPSPGDLPGQTWVSGIASRFFMIWATREAQTIDSKIQKNQKPNCHFWGGWNKERENESESHSVVSNSLWPHGLYSTWNSPGQNTGVGGLSLLRGSSQPRDQIQGSNPGLPHCRWIFNQLSHQGSPRILKWVAYSFSSGSFRPRNRTGVSWISGGFFTNWATREAKEGSWEQKQGAAHTTKGLWADHLSHPADCPGTPP